MAQQMRSKPDLRKHATALTRRERQIMRLVSEGLSNKEIGRRLNVRDGTMKVHLQKHL
jgi:two-component system nitrate/nitrite response regulator NarL